MGSPLSSIIADLAMTKLECDILSSLNFHVPLYLRYVDDILILIRPEFIECIKKNLIITKTDYNLL